MNADTVVEVLGTLDVIIKSALSEKERIRKLCSHVNANGEETFNRGLARPLHCYRCGRDVGL